MAESFPYNNEDWLQSLVSNAHVRNSICDQHFSYFDTNHNDQLDPAELHNLVSAVCRVMKIAEPSQDTLQTAFEKFDKSHTGTLSRQEFQRFFEMFLRSSLPKVHDANELGKEQAYKDMKEAQARMKADSARFDQEFEASFERWYKEQTVDVTRLSYHSMQWIGQADAFIDSPSIRYFLSKGEAEAERNHVLARPARDSGPGGDQDVDVRPKDMQIVTLHLQNGNVVGDVKDYDSSRVRDFMRARYYKQQQAARS